MTQITAHLVHSSISCDIYTNCTGTIAIGTHFGNGGIWIISQEKCLDHHQENKSGHT